MQGRMGLIGALAGGTVAFLGQYILKLADRKNEFSVAFIEQSAQLVALSEDYRNRVWEERRLDLQGRVSEWDLSAYRLSEARLRILCRDTLLLEAVKELHEAGESLGKEWRSRRENEDEIELAWRRHRVALDQFIDTSAVVIERAGNVRRRRIIR